MVATHITLSANVAQAAIQEASLEDQIEATNKLIGINRQILSLLNIRSQGYAAGTDVVAQRHSSLSWKQRFPAPEATPSRIICLPSLPRAVPAQAPPENSSRKPDPPVRLAARPTITLGAARPDVLQAQANLHAASAQVGIATANRHRDITLSANAGSNALSIGVFGPGTGPEYRRRTAGAHLHGRTLLHQQGPRAAYQQSAEQYRGTVLTAFQNVADAAALEHDAETLKATATATDSAKASLDLSRLQYKDGYAAYLAVLNAEQAYQQARLSEVQAEADRFTDTAALFQALGGGWWHRPELMSAANAR
jgi:outer membrane protein TolC